MFVKKSSKNNQANVCTLELHGNVPKGRKITSFKFILDQGMIAEFTQALKNNE